MNPAQGLNLDNEPPWTHKWWMLSGACVSWMCVYYVAWLPSFVEDSFNDYYNFTSSEYSYVISVCYFGAMIGSFGASFLLITTNYTMTVIKFNILLFISHALVTIILCLYNYDFMITPYAWLMVARFLVGICIGAIDTIVQSIVGEWFENTPYTSLAFSTLIIALEGGIILGRYSQPFLVSKFNVPVSLFAGLAMSGITLIHTMIVHGIISNDRKNTLDMGNLNSDHGIGIDSNINNILINEESINDGNDSPVSPINVHSGSLNNDVSDNGKNSEIGILSQFKLLKELTALDWSAMAILILFNIVMNILASCIIEPFVDIYDYTEEDADFLWSITAWVDIFTVIIIANILDKYLCFIELTIFGWIAFTAAFIMIIYKINAILSVSIITIGILCGPACFAMLQIVVKTELTPIASAMATTLWWIFSILFTNAFGWIHDYTGSYIDSMMLLFALSALTIVISLVTSHLDKTVNREMGGILHYKKPKRLSQSDGQERLLSN